jgi:hypothetical protein
VGEYREYKSHLPRALRQRRGHGNQSNAGYRGRRAKSARPREERSAILADHSTEGCCASGSREGGEVMLKRPTEGKEKPGMTGTETTYGRYLEITNRINKTSGTCKAGTTVSRQGIHHPGTLDGRGVLSQLAVAIPLILLAQLFNINNVYGLGPIVVFLGYISAMIAIVNLAPRHPLDGASAWKLIPMLVRERRNKNIKKSKKSKFKVV